MRTVPNTTKIILAGKIFDPYKRDFLVDQVISVSEESGLILDVRSKGEYEEAFGAVSPGEALVDEAEGEKEEGRRRVTVVDLSGSVVLPGFVDAHVHLFLHPYTETPWTDQLTQETLVERTLRAANHAKATLLAGFTTVRDLGTEGAGDADVALRRCMSGESPVIPGPRYFCANRAIVPTGAYGPKGSLHVNEEGIEGVTGAEVADGCDGCRKAVRRQIGAGADWIKFYADYSVRSRMADVAPTLAHTAISTFTGDEVQTIVETAHYYGVKVAAHAAPAGIHWLTSGVDTIEHGYDLDEHVLELMAYKQVIWVPTLAAYYMTRMKIPSLHKGKSVTSEESAWDRAGRTFKAAMKVGVRIACGGDTGVFAHGENALEMQLMHRLGASWKDVLTWATLGGWECVRSMEWEGVKGEARLESIEELENRRDVVGDNEMAFGVIRKGYAADIVATSGDLEKDFENAVSPGNIEFVMKAGKVYKLNGASLI